MNPLDILKYGNHTFLAAIEAIPGDYWFTSGVCGQWSVKDLVAHLASFEQVLVEILGELAGREEPTPTLAAFIRDNVGFNDQQVALRQHQSIDAVLAEYTNAHAHVMQLAADLPADMFIAAGTLPWYGTQYSLDDFIVYTYYGHKREHSAQIDAFATTVKHTMVVEQFNTAFNQRDVAAFMALTTPDVIFDNTSPAPNGTLITGQAAVGDTFEAMFRTTPSTHFTHEQVTVRGNHATVLWRYDWRNLEGETGHIRGVDVLRLNNGKIAEKRSYVKG